MGVTCYQVLGVIPPVSMAELKAAYRKAAAKHHPDRGGNHEVMVRVNDAYEQAKWEIGRTSNRTNSRTKQRSKTKNQRKPKPPRSDIPLSIWYLNIDELILVHKQKGYKKGWVGYRLLDSTIKPPIEAWEYLAQRLDYLPQWSKYKYEEWKPLGERETAE